MVFNRAFGDEQGGGDFSDGFFLQNFAQNLGFPVGKVVCFAQTVQGATLLRGGHGQGDIGCQ